MIISEKSGSEKSTRLISRPLLQIYDLGETVRWTFRSNLIINLKRPIYKAFESFATQNGNILATIKYSQKIKSYQTSSPIALIIFNI